MIGDRGVLAMDAGTERLSVVSDRGPAYAFLEWGSDVSRPFLQAFIDAVHNDTETPVTGEDGLRALEVALCAYESARLQAPVSCPLTQTARAE